MKTLLSCAVAIFVASGIAAGAWAAAHSSAGSAGGKIASARVLNGEDVTVGPSNWFPGSYRPMTAGDLAISRKEIIRLAISEGEAGSNASGLLVAVTGTPAGYPLDIPLSIRNNIASSYAGPIAYMVSVPGLEGTINLAKDSYPPSFAAADFSGPRARPAPPSNLTGSHAPNRASIIAPPTYTESDESTPLTAFNGDWSHTFPATEYWILGSATLGQPTVGYRYTPPAVPRYLYVYNESGWNNSTTDNVGRTAAVAYRTKIYQRGQGDMVAYNCSGFVDNGRAGATGISGFLASPAVSCFNGDLTAGADHAYLNAYETYQKDAGFDVAAIGAVHNLERTNSAGALGAFWVGDRVQSKGSAALDAAYSPTGPINIVLDTATATLGTSKSAITIKADDRVYFNSTNTSPIANPRLTDPGNTYIAYASNSGALEVTVGGVLAVQASPKGVIRPALSGTTGAIGGQALAAGECASGTATVTGVTSAMVLVATPIADPKQDRTHGVSITPWMSAADTVTVEVCAIVASTPRKRTYNVRAVQ